MISSINNFFDMKDPSFDSFCFISSNARVYEFLNKTEIPYQIMPKIFHPLIAKIQNSMILIHQVGKLLCYNSSFHCYAQRSYAFLDAALMIQEKYPEFLKILTSIEIFREEVNVKNLLDIVTGKSIDSFVYTLSWMVGYQLFAEMFITAKELYHDFTKCYENHHSEFRSLNRYIELLGKIFYRSSYILLRVSPYGRATFLLSKMITMAAFFRCLNAFNSPSRLDYNSARAYFAFRSCFEFIRMCVSMCK